MPVVSLKHVCLNIGSQALLDKVQLSIEPGERLCLLGRNGEGKSTLLRVIAGRQSIESGEVQINSGTVLAELPQDIPRDTAGTVFNVVASGLGELGAVLAEYHALLGDESADLEKLGKLQHRIDADDGWNLDARVSAVITRLELPANTQFSALSGGLKRRVLLARALVREPDVLLLDEPTNHLDVDSIRWLEDFLLSWNGTLLFITHDRAFLRRLATRIIELDRGHLTSWPGDYDNYLRRKQEALDAEAQANALFDKKLAQEETWIRQGIQARRTRNEGRVRALKQLREEYRERRTRQGSATMVLQEAERSGKLVTQVEHLYYSWGGTPLITDFSATILRGDRIGIIGPNGVGKTTLLKLLLGQLEPNEGTVELGTKLQIAYFDQTRAALDEDKPVYQNIGDGHDFVEIGGAKKHVMGYLQEFLFTPERARSPVRILSGGERARLLLARLFSQPTNLLVLDEPTNDLDLETLDLLEEKLQEYQGTLFLVSHDRDFLNRVVTRSFVFDAPGTIGDYVGGYDDWLRQRPVTPVASAASAPPAKAPKSKPRPNTKKSPLTHAQRKELNSLPGKLEKLEAKQHELAERLTAPNLFQDTPEEAQKLQSELNALEDELATCFERWEELESLATS